MLAEVDNLILGLNAAMPPGLVTAAAERLREERRSPFNLYYMHGTEVLQETLLSPELHNKVPPRPLFLSAHDRKSLRKKDLQGWIEFGPATFPQVGRLRTEQISPDCLAIVVSPMDRPPTCTARL